MLRRLHLSLLIRALRVMSRGNALVQNTKLRGFRTGTKPSCFLPSPACSHLQPSCPSNSTGRVSVPICVLCTHNCWKNLTSICHLLKQEFGIHGEAEHLGCEPPAAHAHERQAQLSQHAQLSHCARHRCVGPLLGPPYQLTDKA